MTQADPGAPDLKPASPEHPLLIYAVSGLGKSTLASTHPASVLDADSFLYAAVAMGFPGLKPRARLIAWRELCGSRPWEHGGAALRKWASIRRDFVEPFVEAMESGTHPVVVTSLLHPPWFVSAYYGVTRDRYLEHLRLAGRVADNRQSEAMNNRLDGYVPLVRLPPGTFLGQRAEILRLVNPGGSPEE